jgi:DNA repair protein SbcC/Rad50
MKLRNLFITRMPGFEKGGPELRDLSPGLNIIRGDNGSGKTTTCRAVRALLWPEKRSQLDIIGDWTVQSGELHIELNHSGRETSPGDPPPLPEAAVADCYTITVDDLFDGSSADNALAAKLVQEMAGGYDLQKARSDSAFDVTPRHGRNESKALVSAQKALLQLQAEQTELQSREDNLEELTRKKESASRAQARAAILEQALKLKKAREELTQAQIATDGFPDGMNKLVGDEIKTLKQLQKDARREEKALQEAGKTLGESRNDLTLCNFENGVPLELEIASQEGAARKAERCESDISTLTGELESAQSRASSAAEALRSVGPRERLENLDIKDLDAIPELYQRTEKNREQRREIDVQLESLQSKAPEFSSEDLSSGMAALRDWLRQTESAAPLSDRARKIIFGSVGLAVIVSVVLAVTVTPLALIASAPLLVIVFIMLKKEGEAPDIKGQMQRRYEETKLPKVSRWETQVVMDALGDLEQRRHGAIQYEKDQQQTHEKNIKLKRLDEQWKDIEQDWQKVRESTGLSLENSELSLVQASERLTAFQKANDDARAMSARIDAMRLEDKEHLRSVTDYTKTFGGDPARDAAGALATLADLRKRMETHERARKEIAAAEKSIAAATERAEELGVRVRAVFTDIGLEDGDQAGLHKRMELLEEYRKANALVRDARARINALKALLPDDDEHEQLLGEEIETLIIEARSEADEYEKIVEQITEIKVDIENATKKNDMESALDLVIRSKELLREKRDQALLAAAGDFLMDELEEQYRREAQPAVVTEAARLFGAFTLGRYELRVDAAQSGSEAFFKARDTQSGRLQNVDELSRGARMQLLLAARIAFAKHAELGETIPLFLDEALTNSDPERFYAIAQSLLHLVKSEDRQIIYFTCRPEDALAWDAPAKEAGVENVGHFDLDEMANRKNSTIRPLPETAIVRKSIPAPEGRSMLEYGAALSVPDFDPAGDFGATHIFHMLDDPNQLHALLRIGIKSWGQVETLRRCGASIAVGLDDKWEKMSARADLLKAISDAWSQGRGKPFDEQALRDGGVSGRFVDEVQKLSGSLDQDAARLIHALEQGGVPGFRKSTTEKLRSHFIDQGYLDETPCLEKNEALARVFAEMTEHLKNERITREKVADLFARYWK